MAGLRFLTFVLNVVQSTSMQKLIWTIKTSLFFIYIFFFFPEMQMDQLSIIDLENVKLYNFCFFFCLLIFKQ